MTYIKRFISLAAVFVFIITGIMPAAAAVQSTEDRISHAVVFAGTREIGIGKNTSELACMDVKTEKIILDTKMHEKFNVTGKAVMLMVAYTSVRNVKSNTLKVTRNCIKDNKNNVLGLKADMTVNVNDLLAAVLLYDDVNAARTLALGIGGSADRFLEMMKYLAHMLGMNDTVYKNAEGTFDGDAVSSAYDYMILTAACYGIDTIVNITSASKYYIRTESIGKNKKTLENPFPLVDSTSEAYNAHVFGIGTYTDSKGCNVSSVICSSENKKFILTIRTAGKNYLDDIDKTISYIGNNFDHIDISHIIFELSENMKLKLGEENVIFTGVKSSAKITEVIVNQYYSKSLSALNENYSIKPPEKLPETVNEGDVIEGFRVMYKDIVITTLSMTVKSIGDVTEETTSKSYPVYSKSDAPPEPSFLKKHSWVVVLLIVCIFGACIIRSVNKIRKV